MSNFGNSRQNVINFDDNLPKIEISRPGLQLSSPGLNPDKRKPGIPGLTYLTAVKYLWSCKGTIKVGFGLNISNYDTTPPVLFLWKFRFVFFHSFFFRNTGSR
jgi:hypothetical protein